MPPATFASTSALIGGALWVLQWVVGAADDPLGQTLHWSGLAFVLLAVAVAAAGLVTGDVVALKVLVTAAAPLLAWSVIEFFRPDGAGLYAAGWGAAAISAGAWGFWRARASLVPAPQPSRGSHADAGHARRVQARGAHAR